MDSSITWNLATIEASGSFTERLYNLEIDGLHVHAPPIEAELTTVKVQVGVALSTLSWNIRSITVDGDSFKYASVENNNANTEATSQRNSFELPIAEIQQSLDWIGRIKHFAISINRLEIQSGETQFTGTAVTKKRSGKDLELEVAGTLNSKKDATQVRLSLLQQVQFQSQDILSIDLTVQDATKPLNAHATLVTSATPMDIKLHWNGAPGLDSGNLQAKLSSDAVQITPKIQYPVAKFGLLETNPNCLISLKWNAKQFINMNCGVTFTKQTRRKTIPSSATATIKASLTDSGVLYLGQIGITLDELQHTIYEGRGMASAQFSTNPNNIADTFKLISNKIDIDLKVAEFQKIVDMLHSSPFPIPRPFSALRGPVTIKLGEPLSNENRTYRLPFKITTNLKSNKQVVKTTSTGFIERTPSNLFYLSADVSCNQVSLIAPPIGLTGTKPVLVEDARFLKPGKKPTANVPTNSPESLNYKIRVHSPKAAIVRWSELKDAVPVNFDLLLRPAGLKGSVSLGPTSLELFGRTGTLEAMHLTAHEDGVWEIDGKLFSDQGPYRLFLEIRGTSERPQITFSSQPPLSNDEIVSIFVFGRTPDLLNTKQNESVGNFRAAVAEGALNLLSLYALSSTPIQSIGYEPQSGTVRAQVSLGEGTSLVFGSDLSSQHSVGLQKRIGNNWWINSSVETDGGLKDKNVSTFVEWMNHY